MKMNKVMFIKILLSLSSLIAVFGLVVGLIFILIPDPTRSILGGVLSIVSSGMLFFLSKLLPQPDEGKNQEIIMGRMAITELLMAFSWLFAFLGILLGGYIVVFKVQEPTLFLGGFFLLLGVALFTAVWYFQKQCKEGKINELTRKKVSAGIVLAMILTVAIFIVGIHFIVKNIHDVKMLFYGFGIIFLGIFLAGFIRMFGYIGQMIHELKEAINIQTECRRNQLDIINKTIWTLQEELRFQLHILRDNQQKMKEEEEHIKHDVIRIRDCAEQLTDNSEIMKNDVENVKDKVWNIKENINHMAENSDYLADSHSHIKGDTQDLNNNVHEIKSFFEDISRHLEMNKDT